MLLLRTSLSPCYKSTIIDIAISTDFFSKDEIQVLGDLVQDHITRGPIKSGYSFLVAEINGQLVGYTCYGPIPGTYLRYSLYWIVVHPFYQGQNIGTKLLNETERLIKKACGQRIYLETSSEDKYASTRAFYCKNKYMLVVSIPHYYDDGTDKLIYQKDLVLDSNKPILAEVPLSMVNEVTHCVGSKI